jgi:O-acetyl-ADP-ribose deacetylase (regulator of RNase III)
MARYGTREHRLVQSGSAVVVAARREAPRCVCEDHHTWLQEHAQCSRQRARSHLFVSNLRACLEHATTASPFDRHVARPSFLYDRERNMQADLNVHMDLGEERQVVEE